MGKRIAVIMTYVNRYQQLLYTLHTLNNSEHKDWAVFIANDGPDEISFPYPNVHVLPVLDKTWVNQLPAYNMALKYALDNYRPDAFIIQNPECYHVGDVLQYVADNLTNDNYMTFATYSLDREHTFDPALDIDEVIAANDKTVDTDNGLGWYNHPVHRPVCYEFCAAISRDNMIMMNGYDERMAYGIAYDDDYTVWRVRQMGLKVEIVTDPFAVHQWHAPANEHPNKTMLVQKNHALLHTLVMQGNIRAEHLITPDL